MPEIDQTIKKYLIIERQRMKYILEFWELLFEKVSNQMKNIQNRPVRMIRNQENLGFTA